MKEGILGRGWGFFLPLSQSISFPTPYAWDRIPIPSSIQIPALMSLNLQPYTYPYHPF